MAYVFGWIFQIAGLAIAVFFMSATLVWAIVGGEPKKLNKHLDRDLTVD